MPGPGTRAGGFLLVVPSPAPSPAMDRAREELPPILVAEGTPAGVLAGSGTPHTLTSDTTRRIGVVSNEDVAPTLLSFLHVPVPSEMNGSPIRVVRDAGAPIALHRENLENRRISTPTATGALAWALLLGVASLLPIAC